METKLQTEHPDLDLAQSTLRDVLGEEFRKNAGSEAGSLDRILIHVGNIRNAIEESPECLANAAKRLGDFAEVTSRMRSKYPESSTELTSASQALRAASVRLLDSLRTDRLADSTTG